MMVRHLKNGRSKKITNDFIKYLNGKKLNGRDRP